MAAKSNLSKYQNFRIATINRGQIKQAPYNPRVMSDEHRKLLRQSLKANGLVEPLVWNERTGNLVGGHQRIEALDAMERRDDYDLTVSVVDVDERQEKNLNMALNNRNLQGTWDEDKLADLLRECASEDFEAIGVTDADLEVLLGSTSGLGAYRNDTPERQQMKDTLADIKRDRSEMNARLAEQNRVDLFAVLIFEDEADRDVFCKAFKVHPADQYIRGSDLVMVLGAK